MKISVQMPSSYDDRDERMCALLRCVRESMSTVKESRTDLTLLPSSAIANHTQLGARFNNDALVLDCMREAATDGADGIIDYCFFDPALWPARQLLEVPVVGLAEASMHLASFVGRKFAIITPDARYVPAMGEAVERYGFHSRSISHRPVRPLGISEADAITLLTNERTNELATIFASAALECIADGADTIIVGCGVLAAILGAEASLSEIEGVPVINPAVAAIKAVEALVSLDKAGLPFKTARGYWGAS